MIPPPVIALSGLVDSFFRRALVQRRFTPRKLDGYREWLSKSSTLLATLSDAELFPNTPLPTTRPLAHSRYHGQPTHTFSWQRPRLPAEELLGLSVKTGEPRVTLLGQGHRPLWVLIHGWLGGSRLMDEVLWPVRALCRTHDVALFVLPGHGARTEPVTRVLPTFPSRNPVRNVLGLLAAVTEVRMLVAWLRGIGYEQIGLAGTSLGVQVAALLATVDTSVDRFLFDRPLADLVEPLQRRVSRESAETRDLFAALRDFYRPVSPFQRPSRALSQQVDVVLGCKDKVVGRKEAETLSRHFEVRPRTYPCGHVLSLGRERLVVELMQKLEAK